MPMMYYDNRKLAAYQKARDEIFTPFTMDDYPVLVKAAEDYASAIFVGENEELKEIIKAIFIDGVTTTLNLGLEHYNEYLNKKLGAGF